MPNPNIVSPDQRLPSNGVSTKIKTFVESGLTVCRCIGFKVYLMQLKYLQTILPAQDPSAKVVGLSWSPNNLKLAVATADRAVLLFDDRGEKRDKFSLKPSDSKYGKKSFSVKGIAFSPDSTKIAVGQTDNIVYVYRIGEKWGDKKVICNKFAVSSAVTSLIWLAEGPLVFGTADGKVRLANCKTNKASTLYGVDSFVVSLASNFRGTGFLSGHADGTVVRFYVADDAQMDPQGKVVTCPLAPYALAWTLNHIVAAGCDKKIAIYEKDGKLVRLLDYTKEDEKAFTVACCSPSGQAVAVGSFDRVRLLAWNSAKAVWEENLSKEIKNVYTVTAMQWKRDGSKVALGTLCGGLILLESVLKRTIYKDKFEITYVGASQVLVKELTGSAGVILRSQFGHEIDDVRIMGRDRYAVGRTPHTILLGDLERNLASEIMWSNSGRNEKFYFDNVNVCLIFNVGELSLVEYGENEILGSVRTEFMNPHVISVRLNERRIFGSSEDNKKLAYLLDLKTICIIDLVYGTTIAHVSHDAKVDWLELNETGCKLLFRDKKQRLMLLDPRTGRKEPILTNCTFVQWVPGSDVVVAQSLNNLCIWYNIDSPERVTLVPIKGEVVEVVRSEGRTEVVVQNGVHQVGYELDEGLVEFGTAVHDKDFGRAVVFLESMGERGEAEGMWHNLAAIALSQQKLKVAERCFAALGDMSKSKFLKETIRVGEEIPRGNDADLLPSTEVWVRLAILKKQIKTAEEIYLEQNEIDKAIDMYRKFHKWNEAIELSRAKGSEETERLREEHFKWLMESRQEEKAGELKEKEGDHLAALNLYLEAKQPGRAFRLLQNYSYLLENEELIRKVLSALVQSDSMEQAGMLYEKINQGEKALECYKKGKAFAKAVDLGKRIAPGEIKKLEEQWGDWLAESKQLDAAINHYIEAGRTLKALEAAVNGRLWKKAYQIIQVIDDPESVLTHYQKIGEYFLSVKEHHLAETMFLKCGMYKEVIQMYNSAGQWEKAHKVASHYLDSDQVSAMYLAQAQALETEGKLRDVENLFVSISKPDMAISMYKRHRQFDNMIRLVEVYHPELVTITHKHLAQELDTAKHYKLAEQHYVLSGEWKAAVNMYRLVEKWEDAYRVAKAQGGPEAAHQVAFLWARTLGGDAAVRLLNKYNLLEQCIDYSCDNYQFEFAFELAKLSMASKVQMIHYKYAMALEDGGKFEEAEEQFIKAGKPKEAISMYVHAREWQKAEAVAEEYEKSSLPDVLLAQAKDVMDSGDPSTVESLLLRAQKPEMLVKYYQDNDMWLDALRICKEYLPSKLGALQGVYERQVGSRGTKDLSSVIAQAREWEQNGQVKQAINCYVKISALTSDRETVLNSLLKAAELTSKFMDSDDAVALSRVICPKLMELRQFGSAGQLYMACDLVKNAVDAYVRGNEWAKARKIARDYEPALEAYVETRYKEHLTKVGDVEHLADVDATAALDLMARQGNWSQCLEKSKEYGPHVLHKYLAIHATQLIKEGDILQVVNLYNKYEAPAFPQYYHIYKRICKEMLAMANLNEPESYDHWAGLRNMLFNVTEAMRHSQEADSATHNEFQTLLLIAHYYAARSAYKGTKSLQPLATKVSIALLRYTDIIPPDKAFFEAGIDAKAVGRDSEAFVFLNRYLDICDSIDEAQPEFTDFNEMSDFSATDFPSEVALPTRQIIDPTKREQVKDWVLSVSMDQRIDQVLPLDERNLYESCLTSVNYADAAAAPCVVTGYPVLATGARKPVQFKNPEKAANRDDWNNLMMATKASIGTHLNDLIAFISDWCGSIPSLSF